MRSTPLITLFFVIAGCAASPASVWSPPWEDRETLIAAYLPMQDLSEDVPNRYEEWVHLLERTEALIEGVHAEWNETVEPVSYFVFESLWDPKFSDITENQIAYSRHLLKEINASGIPEEIDSFAGTPRFHPALDDVSMGTFKRVWKLGSVNDLFEVCRANMMLSAQAGNWEDSLIWLDRCMILNSISGVYVSTLDVVVHLGQRRVLHRYLMTIMHTASPSKDTLIRWRDSFYETDSFERFRASLIQNAVIAIPSLVELEAEMQDPGPQWGPMIAFAPEVLDAKAPARRRFARVQIQLNEFTNVFLRASRMPGVSGLESLPEDDVSAAAGMNYVSSRETELLFDLHYSVYRRLLLTCLQHENSDKATRIAIALHIYDHDHNGFPESLDALVPSYLDELPVDHFAHDGRFRYAKSDDPEVGYRLYSVGRDREDRGGRWPNDWYYPPDAYPRD